MMMVMRKEMKINDDEGDEERDDDNEFIERLLFCLNFFKEIYHQNFI